ncbi:MAG: hypothetical protein KDA49_04345 [Rhodospirillaceae bacterium]|nr:hypothetical protein [Rhodospirillaceae bacterium]MCA8931671.1 hypothetical protein [Rhodospirillaceae bacterium]
MSDVVQELYEKAETYSEKYSDQELYDYLLTLANKLEQAEMVRHHFGYFLMHAKAVCPYDARPRHFQEALDRAEKFLKQP